MIIEEYKLHESCSQQVRMTMRPSEVERLRRLAALSDRSMSGQVRYMLEMAWRMMELGFTLDLSKIGTRDDLSRQANNDKAAAN